MRKLVNYCKLEFFFIIYIIIDFRCNISVRVKIFKYYKKMEVLYNSVMESFFGLDIKDSIKKENW